MVFCFVYGSVYPCSYPQAGEFTLGELEIQHKRYQNAHILLEIGQNHDLFATDAIYIERSVQAHSIQDRER